MNRNSFLKFTLAIAVMGLSAASSFADDVTTLTTGITQMVTDGGTVGSAALAIFIALMTLMIIKKFARAGA